MIPGKYNIVCPQGSTLYQTITVYENEEYKDLTGYTARMQVREKHSSEIVILDLDTENDGIQILPSVSKIAVNVSAEDTASIVAKNYVYDLEIISGLVVTRLIEGYFMVTPEVTR